MTSAKRIDSHDAGLPSSSASADSPMPVGSLTSRSSLGSISTIRKPSGGSPCDPSFASFFLRFFGPFASMRTDRAETAQLDICAPGRLVAG